jgi:hypothetical protein
MQSRLRDSATEVQPGSHDIVVMCLRAHCNPCARAAPRPRADRTRRTRRSQSTKNCGSLQGAGPSSGAPKTSSYLSSSMKERETAMRGASSRTAVPDPGSPPARDTGRPAYSPRAFLERCGVHRSSDSGGWTATRTRRGAPHPCSRAKAGGSPLGKSSRSDVASDRDSARLDRHGGNQDEINLTCSQARWQHGLDLVRALPQLS